MLSTKFLICELTSAITVDSAPGSEGSCEIEAPDCAALGTTISMEYLGTAGYYRSTLVGPNLPDIFPSARSPCIPSPFPAVVPAAETIGGSDVPDNEQCQLIKPCKKVKCAVELERLFGRQKAERGVASGSFMLVLDSVEG